MIKGFILGGCFFLAAWLVLALNQVSYRVDATVIALAGVICILLLVLFWSTQDRNKERKEYYADRREERRMVYADRESERATTARDRADERRLVGYVMREYAISAEIARALLAHVQAGTHFVEDRTGRYMELADGQVVDATSIPRDEFDAGRDIESSLN